MLTMRLCLLLLFLTIPKIKCKVYFVNSNYKYHDTVECLQEEDAVPCYSLEYVADHVSSKNNITIIINSQTTLMKSVAIFSNIEGITIAAKRIVILQCMVNGSLTDSSTGLVFNSSTSVTIKNIKLINCTSTFNNNVNHSCGILIHSSKNILITRVEVHYSNGYGLMINDTENVRISKSEFSNNIYISKTDCFHGSGGVFIKANNINKPSKHTISDVKFKKNGKICSEDTKLSENKGGGMRISHYNSNNITIAIINCLFEENSAYYGGGLHILKSGSSLNNTVQVNNCAFSKNTAYESGGGSDVGFIKESEKADPQNSTIIFSKCRWYANKSFNDSGGLSIFTTLTCFTTKNCYLGRNSVRLEKCHFKENESRGVTALKASFAYSQKHGTIVLTETHIHDCYFVKNKATTNGRQILSQGSTVLSSKLSMHFTGINVFDSNKGTALHLLTAIATFENSSNIFVNNTADRGAGIYLSQQSFIALKQRNYFNFTRNRAMYGGALLVAQTNSYEYRHLDHCFLKGNISSSSYYFKTNKADEVGSDMFIYTLLPCAREDNNITEMFEQKLLGNFTFSNGFAVNQSITTTPYSLETAETIYPVPGKEMTIHIKQFDQLQQEMKDFFGLLLQLNENENPNINIELKTNTIITSSNSPMKFNGLPGQSTTLTIESIHRTTPPIQVKVTMAECYPGFRYNNMMRICECSDMTRTTAIPHCIRDENALLRVGYWAGYIKFNKPTFATGACLSSFCSFNSSQMYMEYLNMSNDKHQLEKDVCSENRAGTLCSQCVNGTSVYYNSPQYSCRKNKQCDFGLFYFFLSEIIPTTILFLIILFFNVRLTSGSVYTLILYIQMVGILSIYGFGKLKFNKTVEYILSGYQVLYGVANLRFLQLESLSFCIWEGATTMDVIILKYAVAGYSIILILGTLLLLKVYSLYMCIRMCKRCGRRNVRYSVVHSLSAFIIICFFRMIRTSITLVSCVKINTHGDKTIKKVALFDGHLTCNSRQHLLYMIPAIICLIFTSIPALLLIVEPLLLKVTSKINFEIQLKCLNDIRSVFKPFLDSFQGCFKNNCRVFAGLFFAYRIALGCCLIPSNEISDQYINAMVILITIILIHAIVQPFAKNWHNKVDLFLWINILLVVLLSYINLTSTTTKNTNLIAAVQIVIASAPLAFVAVYLVTLTKEKCKHRLEKKNDNDPIGQEIIFAKLESKLLDYK